jgi:hypothetical protein
MNINKSGYGYIVNELGERRSPIGSVQSILPRWFETTRPYYTGETLSIHIMSLDEWYDESYPGHWVDEGQYQ